MRIGIDIDDTMADTFDYLMPFIAEYFEMDFDYLKENNISYSNLPDTLKDKEIAFAKKYYDEVIINTPFKPYVAKYINKIRQLGHYVIIVTARDKRFYTNPKDTTRKELKKNGINYDKLVCDFDKKKVCKNEKIDLLIDDSIMNCYKASQLGIKTILFHSKANAQLKTTIPRVKTWKELYEKIKQFK